MPSKGLKRWEMHLTLSEQPLSETWATRSISQDDAVLLGRLLYEAYYGTIDYDEETPEEAEQVIQGILSGKYGPLLTMCSFLVEKQGQALGACMVTHWTDRRMKTKRPLMTLLMVHPDAKGKGMGTFLARKSIDALMDRGEKEFVLFVTVGNHDAQHIYQKLGFQVVEEFTTRRRILARFRRPPSTGSGGAEEEKKKV